MKELNLSELLMYPPKRLAQPPRAGFLCTRTGYRRLAITSYQMYRI